MTILQCVQRASARLADAGLSRDESHRDASLLARFVLSWDDADWLLRRNGEASESFAADFERLVHRRERREPVAYITGRREFLMDGCFESRPTFSSPDRKLNG